MAPATSNQLLNRLEETIHQIPFAFVPTNSELNLYLGGKIKFNANSYDLPLFFLMSTYYCIISILTFPQTLKNTKFPV